MTSLPSEALISRAPVIVRRRVKWGECDPAGVVYTPRIRGLCNRSVRTFRRLNWSETQCKRAWQQPISDYQ